MNIAMLPPSTIDGANVLEYAWSHRPFGFIACDNGNSSPIAVHGLALCRYAQSEVIYRFSCSATWETLQDMDYGSIEEAKQLLPQQYRNVTIVWHRYPTA